MSLSDVGERLVQSQARIDSYLLKNAHLLKPHHRKFIAEARTKIESNRFEIDSDPDRTISQIGSLCRRLKAKGKLDVMIVDYLQFIAVEGGNNRQEQIAQVSRRLKVLARDLKIPVIALAQLNRDVDKREDKTPRISDLRESGSIEQDADVVILLHRPEYYDANDQPGLAEVIVAKNRNGPTSTIKLIFERQYARFADVPRPVEPPDEDHPF